MPNIFVISLVQEFFKRARITQQIAVVEQHLLLPGSLGSAAFGTVKFIGSMFFFFFHCKENSYFIAVLAILKCVGAGRSFKGGTCVVVKRLSRKTLHNITHKLLIIFKFKLQCSSDSNLVLARVSFV